MFPTRKDEILTQAARLFRKRGYRGTSLKTIANAVGMEAAPSLYNHISSKQAILAELLLTVARRFEKGMNRVLAQERSPREQLTRLISLHVQLTVEHPDAIALVWQEWVHLKDDHQEEFLKLRNHYEQHFRQILQNGMEQGAFRAFDLELTLFALLSTLRALYAWYARNQDYGRQHLEEQLTRILLLGLVEEHQ